MAKNIGDFVVDVQSNGDNILIGYNGKDVAVLKIPDKITGISEGVLDGLKSLTTLVVKAKITQFHRSFIAPAAYIKGKRGLKKLVIEEDESSNELHMSTINWDSNCCVWAGTRDLYGSFNYEQHHLILPNLSFGKMRNSLREVVIRTYINDYDLFSEVDREAFASAVRRNAARIVSADGWRWGIETEIKRDLLVACMQRGVVFTPDAYDKLIEFAESIKDQEFKSMILEAYAKNVDRDKEREKKTMKETKKLLDPTSAAAMSETWTWTQNAGGTSVELATFRRKKDYTGWRSKKPKIGTLELPAVIAKKEVTSIGEYLLNSVPVDEIVLPDTVEKIGIGAFDSTYAQQIRFPGNPNLKVFPFKMLANTCIEKVVIPQSVEELGEFCLFSSKTKEIVLHDGIRVIGPSCFYSSHIESISVPKKICVLPLGFCGGAKNLQEVSLHDDVVVIGSSAFLHTEALKEIRFPKGLVEIADNAFQWSGLEHVDFPESVQYIGSGAFTGCKMQDIHKRGGFIGESAFAQCQSLEIASLYDVAILKKWLFRDCKVLHQVLALDARIIESQAFGLCPSLTEVHLGKVTECAKDAFVGCKELKRVYVNKDTDLEVFRGVFPEGEEPEFIYR